MGRILGKDSRSGRMSVVRGTPGAHGPDEAHVHAGRRRHGMQVWPRAVEPASVPLQVGQGVAQADRI